MLVLRLQRTGRRNVPAFRLVVAEKDAPIKGRVREYLGHYLPTRNPHEFECKQERITHWISVGAQPTNTVARLLKQKGMEGMEKYIKRYTKQKKRKQVEEKDAAPAAAPAAEAPVEEKPTKEKATEEKPVEEKAPEEAKKKEGAEDDTEKKDA